MKTIKAFATLLSAALIITAMASCQDLDNNPSPYAEYAIEKADGLNTAHFVNTPYAEVAAGSTQNISFTTTAPFKTRIPADASSNKVYLVGNSGIATNGVITLTMNPDNMPSCTRDVLLYIRDEKYSNIEGFGGQFYFPVRIRQRGLEGTVYLDAAGVAGMRTQPVATLSQTPKKDGNCYAKGTVKAIGSLSQRLEKSGIQGGWNLPWVDDMKHFTNEYIDYVEMIVTVDGEDFPMRVEYLSKYQMFSYFNVNVGDTVEVCVRSEGTGKIVDPKTNVWNYVCTPLDIFKI